MNVSAVQPRAGHSSGFSLARLLDGAAFGTLCAVVSFVVFASRIESPLVAALPSALFTGCAVTAFLLWRRRRIRRTNLALQRLAYDLWLCDVMITHDERRFRKFVSDILLGQCRCSPVPECDGRRVSRDGTISRVAVLRRHPSAPVGAQDVLEEADRTRDQGLDALILATTAGITDDARSLARSIQGVAITLYDGSTLYAMAWDAALDAPDGALEPYLERAAEDLRTQRRHRRIRFSGWAASLRFAAAGAALAALSWLTPYRTWYLLCAAGCLVIAAAALIFPNFRLFKREPPKEKE